MFRPKDRDGRFGGWEAWDESAIALPAGEAARAIDRQSLHGRSRASPRSRTEPSRPQPPPATPATSALLHAALCTPAAMASALLSPLNNILAFLTPPPPPVQDAAYDGFELTWRFFVFRPARTSAVPCSPAIASLTSPLSSPSLQKRGVAPRRRALLRPLLLPWTAQQRKQGKRLVSFSPSRPLCPIKHSPHPLAPSRIDAHAPLYAQQFSRPTNAGLTADGYSDFFTFSTGRRAVAVLHTVFTLRPRHDIFQLAYQFAYRNVYDLQYNPADDVQLDFKLHPGVNVPDFVWALVNKDELKSIKDARWDLVSASFLPPSRVCMLISVCTDVYQDHRQPGCAQLADHHERSAPFVLNTDPALVLTSEGLEFADVTDGVLKVAGPVIVALNDPQVLPYFRSLSVCPPPPPLSFRFPHEAPLVTGSFPSNFQITDQPRERPDIAETSREKHIILTLASPPASAAARTLPLVTAVFALVDALDRVTLRPETKAKLRKVREDFARAQKEAAEKERREEVSRDCVSWQRHERGLHSMGTARTRARAHLLSNLLPSFISLESSSCFPAFLTLFLHLVRLISNSSPTHLSFPRPWTPSRRRRRRRKRTGSRN